MLGALRAPSKETPIATIETTSVNTAKYTIFRTKQSLVV
jgi:hypothetical protein